MNTTSVRTLLTSGIIAIGLMGTSLPAGATPTGPKPGSIVKSACLAAVDTRINALGVTNTKVAEAKRLTADQKASMQAGIAVVSTNLTTINRPAIESASSRASLKAACGAVYSENRVFAVVIPQLFMTMRAEELGNAVDKMTPLAAELKSAGKDTTTLDALLADATVQISGATADFSSVTPDSFNADKAAAAASFEAAREKLQAAFVDVLKAIMEYRNLK